MKSISFIVEGEPRGKDRPRLTTYNGYAHAYSTKNTINYENKILMCYRDKVKGSEYEHNLMFNNDDFVSVNICAYFGLTSGDYGKKGLNKSGRNKIDNIYCTKHKDLDNIVKSVLDALNGVCYKDDKQVVAIHSYKMYTQDQPCVEITISQIETNKDTNVN